MALISLTIQDMPDGTVAVQMADHPKVTEDQVDYSPAQHIGAIVLNAIDKELREPKIIDPRKKKLQIVGADELPH